MSQASQIVSNPVAQPVDARTDASPPATPGSRVRASMARSAIIVGLSFVGSRILGLAREMILAGEFGTSPVMDAYVSAFRIPDLLFLVIMAGAFGAAFIPIFGQYIDRGDDERAWQLASAVLTWAGIGVFILSLLCFVLARPLMYLVAPGFDAETADLAVDLMRILLLSPVFLGLGIAAKGILEAQSLFTLPALAPLIYNAATIVGALFFVDRFGIHAVGWAVIAGALGHVLIQVPGLIRAGIRFRPTLDRHVEGLAEVARLLGPRVIGLAAFQVNFIIVNAFASVSDDAHVSAINFAWQLLMLPHGILALSISTVVFPALAALHSRGDNDAFRSTLDRALRPLIFLSIPASLGLLILREPIIRMIFETGSFDEASTRLVMAPLAWFAFGLLGYALTEILTRVYYATRDTRTPVISGVLTVVLNVLLCAIFMESIGYTGLALALAATTSAEAVILMLFLRARTGHVVTADFWPWLGKVGIAALVMTAVMLLTVGDLRTILRRDGVAPINEYGFFIFTLALYVFTFFGVAWALRIPELHSIVGKVANRLPTPVQGSLQRIGLI